jgi:hypothetical protein
MRDALKLSRTLTKIASSAAGEDEVKQLMAEYFKTRCSSEVVTLSDSPE